MVAASNDRPFFVPVMRALDDDGNPLSGALLYFYLAGGTTPEPVYTSSSLLTAHANPVVADSDGWFAPIFQKDTVAYRVTHKTPGGTTIWEIDPYTMPTMLTQEDVQDIVGAMLSLGTGNVVSTYDDPTSAIDLDVDLDDARPLESFVVAITETATVVTSGVKQFSFRMPYAFTVTEARATLDTGQTGGTTLKVDINEAGTSILGATKLTFDNGQEAAGTAALSGITITNLSSIADGSIADNAEVTFDVDAVGDGTAKGLCVTLIGRRTL